MKNKVSIIIPSYSYGKYLKGAIDSALSQTVPCEVVLFDNASTDSTKKVISQYENVTKKSSNTFIPWTNLLNKLISESKTEYIIILGADDRIEPTFVEKSLEKMTKGVGIVRTGMKTFGSQFWEESPQHPLTTLEQEMGNNILFTSMFRKKAWAEVGGYDEKTPGYEDWDFWVRIMHAGWKVADVPEKLFLYCTHNDSGYHIQKVYEDKIMKYLNKKWGDWHKQQGDYNEWLLKKDLYLKEKEIEALKKDIKNKEIMLKEKDKVIRQKEGALNKIINSRSWKLATTLRNIKSLKIGKE